MLIYNILGFSLILSGLLVFSLKRKHLLVMLLSLEFVVVSMYFSLFLYFSYLDNEFFLMVFLNMSVCEGVLGLAISVSMISTHGNDYILSFSALWYMLWEK